MHEIQSFPQDISYTSLEDKKIISTLWVSQLWDKILTLGYCKGKAHQNRRLQCVGCITELRASPFFES